MESEKDKKEKLASARRKLNEYKMTRSGGGGGSRYQNASSASTNPADVPLFYQNINSQATTFNIFNPAAADNNNTSSSPYFLSTPVSGGDNGSSTLSDYPTSLSFQQQPLTLEESKPTLEVNPPFFNPEPPAVIEPFNSPVKSSLINAELVGDSDHQHQQPAFFQPVTLDLGTEIANASAAFSQSIPSQFGAGFPVAETTNCTFQEAQKDERRKDLQSTFEGFGNQEDLISINSTPLNNDFIPSAPSIVYGSETPAEVVDPPLTDTNEEKVNDISNFNTQDSRPSDETEALHSNNEIENTTPQLFASSLFSSGGAPVGDNERDIFNIVNNQEPPTTASNMSSTELLESIPATLSTALTSSSNVNPVIANPNDEIPFVFNGNLADGKDITFIEKSSETSLHPYVSEELQENNSEVPPGPAAAADVSEGNTRIESTLNYHEQTVGFGLVPIQTTRHDVAPSIQQEVSSHPVTSEDVQVQKEQEILLETNNVANSIQSDETFQHMKSVQEALELQIEELRRENNYLLTRQTELTTRIEDSEKLAHDFKLARDQIKEESMATSQALRGKINSLCEENQRIVKNSTDVGVDLRAKLEEKSKQLEEMQKAVIIVSQSKMGFAERLDHEVERANELQNTLREKDNEINSLRSINEELQSKLKQEQEKDAVIQQLQDQNRHFQVQNETLQKELSNLKRKIHKAGDTRPTELSKPPDGEDHESRQHLENQTSPSVDQSSNEESPLKTYPIEMPETSVCGHDHDHDASNGDGDHHHDHHDHNHHHHDHHDHDDHDHDHDHDHHNHDHIDDKNVGTVARRGPADEVTELKKTIHRLQWENSTYREELDILAVDAKDKRTYEQKCTSLQEENDGLRKEVEQLEHVIIQLQGENDTIGDYITLYQTQKLALKECAKEKDVQLELLAREREMLLHRLAELTALVKDLRDTKSDAGSQCADEHDHIHSLDVGNPHLPQGPKNKHQIEGKIRDLLSEISSSTLIENFHPCALCSGRLMTV